MVKSASAEELGRGRITRQPAIVPSQNLDEPTPVQSAQLPEGKILGRVSTSK